MCRPELANALLCSRCEGAGMTVPANWRIVAKLKDGRVFAILCCTQCKRFLISTYSVGSTLLGSVVVDSMIYEVS